MCPHLFGKFIALLQYGLGIRFAAFEFGQDILAILLIPCRFIEDEFFVTFQVLSSQTFKLLPSLQMTTYDLARVGDAGADASGRNAGFRKKG